MSKEQTLGFIIFCNISGSDCSIYLYWHSHPGAFYSQQWNRTYRQSGL